MRTSPLRFAAVGLFCLLAACTLRPRYGDLMQRSSPPEGAQSVTFQVVSDDGHSPIPNARILINAGKDRFRATTDAQGRFELPVNAQWLKDNPLVIVSAPEATGGYQLRPVDATSSPVPQAEATAPAAAPAPEQPAPTPEQPEGPFAGCEITAPKPEGRVVTCGGIMATVHEAPAGADPEALIDQTIAGFKAASQGAEVSVAREDMQLLGEARRAARVQAVRPGEGNTLAAQGAFVIVPTAAQTRLLTCVNFKPAEEPSARCGPLLEALAGQTPEPTSTAAPKPEAP